MSNLSRTANPDFLPSLRLLVERERYSFHDIGLMFGVSRERVRQWCENKNIIHPDTKRGLAMVRVWDDAKNRFVPVSRLQEFCKRGHRFAETRCPDSVCRECRRIRRGSVRRREDIAPQNEQRDAEIARRHLGGETYNAIAASLGMSKVRCYQIVVAQGVPRRRYSRRQP